MESPVQMFPTLQGDSLFATPNFNQQRDDGLNDDFGYFDSLSSSCDPFANDGCDSHWNQPLVQEVLDPLLSGGQVFGKQDSAFCSPDQLFPPELTPPTSVTDDVDSEELFKPKPTRTKQHQLPQLDTQVSSGAHARRYGQITPPASSKSPEASESTLQTHSGAGATSKRGRKPSAKARKDEEGMSPAKQGKGPARKSRKSTSTKNLEQYEEFEEPEEGQTEEAKAKRARFLERNRQAAFTCRQRKKQWAKDLEERHRNMERDNRDLKAARDSLQEEYRFLRRQLISHSTCECTGAREYIQRSSKVLEALGGDSGPDWVAALSSAGSSASASASASPAAGGVGAMGTPAIEKTLRASLSQMVDDDSSMVDPTLGESEIEEPSGLELDGMTF